MIKKICLVWMLLLLLPVVSAASNFRVLSTDYSHTINPCELASFSFNIENTGEYTETFYIGVDRFLDYTSLSQNPVDVNPGESKEIIAFVQPDCDSVGQYNVNLIINTLNSKQEAKLPLQLNILNTYAYNISFGEFYDADEPITESGNMYYICEGDSEKIPLLISNKANVPNSFTARIKGPNFATLTQDSAVLSGDQTGALLIDVSPSLGSAKEYFITAYVDAFRGGLSKNAAVKLIVEKCYDVSLDIPRGVIVPNCEISAGNFSVYNKGTEDDSFNLYLDAPYWITLGYNSSEIDGNNSDVADINFNVPCDVSGKNKFSIKAVSQGFSSVEEEKVALIEIVPQKLFYSTFIGAPNRVSIRYNALSLPIKVTNNGLREIEYNINLTSPPWASIEPKVVSIKPKETKEVRVLFDINADAPENDYAFIVDLNAGTTSFSKEIVVRLRHRYMNDIIRSAWLNFVAFISYFAYHIITGILLVALLTPGVIKLVKYIQGNKEKVKLFLSRLYITVVSLAVLGGVTYFAIKLGLIEFDLGLFLSSLYNFYSDYTVYIWSGLLLLALIISGIVIYEKKIKVSKKRVKKNSKKRSKKKKK